MAEADANLPDPLILLRQSIGASTPPIPTTSPTPDDTTDDYASATHLTFSAPTAASYPLAVATRFLSGDEPVDLRSIFFAWQHKDAPIPDYAAAAQAANDALAAAAANAGQSVRKLTFVERLDLITWLEGASDDSEYIRPLAGDAAARAQAEGAGPAQAAAAAGIRPGKPVDPVLQAIYDGERRMGDHGSVLRGVKPTDFSALRGELDKWVKTPRPGTKPNPSAAGAGGTNGAAPAAAAGAAVGSATLATHPKPGKPPRRIDPIILLSPSASSLLRMSNIKAFLHEGHYQPPAAEGAAAVNLLHVTRSLPAIDAKHPLRFILVDSPEQFKPDYWQRVVAVFTTGQAWQFKAYKWSSPQELFSHVLGVYVGWRDDAVPEAVRGWGRGVVCVGVEKWRGEGVGRWRDREVVEGLWGRIEDGMRRAGWGPDGPKAAR